MKEEDQPACDRSPRGPRLRNYKKPIPLDRQTFPHPPKRGRLPGTLDNLDFLLDQYGILVRYDLIGKRVDIVSPMLPAGSDNSENAAMAHIVSMANLNGFPRGDVERYVAAIADARPYNPVKEWIGSKPWDGKDRMPAVFQTLVQREGYPAELKHVLMRKWLLSAAAAALVEGFRSRGVLTLAGAQRIGKTQWVNALVDDPVLRRRVIKIDHHLDAHNKDSIVGAVSHLICEIGELDSAMKKDVARLKGVLTRDSDKLRKVYLREESEMPRRTVFAATVNHGRLQVDDTGNSRWWVIPVIKVNWQHSIPMQQVFAQLATELENGAHWWLTDEEEKLLAEFNRAHRSVSVIEDLILDALDLDAIGQPGLPAMTATELLKFVGVPLLNSNSNSLCKECGGILRDYVGDPKRINGRDRWRIPLNKALLEEWQSQQPKNRDDKFD
jgi:putative DNA primase/helicase